MSTIIPSSLDSIGVEVEIVFLSLDQTACHHSARQFFGGFKSSHSVDNTIHAVLIVSGVVVGIVVLSLSQTACHRGAQQFFGGTHNC